MTYKLLRLAQAIVSYEGWETPVDCAKESTPGSRSWRDHNPGNLRSSPFAIGMRGGFAVFVTDDTGFFALVWDLWSKCRGETRTGLCSYSSLADLIRVYSAATGAELENYVSFVERVLGIPRNTALSYFV